MKKTILTFTITGVIAFTSLTTFGQEDKKSKEAKKDVAESVEDLIEAKKDSAADYRKFKMEAEMKIIENHKKIAELKAKKTNESKDVKEKYDKKVLALEQKNDALKKKIDGSNKTKTSMWPSFKREFNHDMAELGQAIKDIGVDNKK